jgi:hypothetical protein
MSGLGIGKSVSAEGKKKYSRSAKVCLGIERQSILLCKIF